MKSVYPIKITRTAEEQTAAHGTGEVASDANGAFGLPLSPKIFWPLFILGNSYLWGHVAWWVLK